METNIYWGKCRDCARFNERTKYGSGEHMRSSTVYNKNEITALSQYGGVTVLYFHQLPHQSRGSGSDEWGLGWWTWMLFREKQNTRTRSLSAHQPNSSKHSKYYSSVHKQQERHFLLIDIDDYPIDLFRKGLCAALKTWLQSVIKSS